VSELTQSWGTGVDTSGSIVLAGVRSLANWIVGHADAMGRRSIRWDDAACQDTGIPNPFANMVAVTAPPREPAAWDDLAGRVCAFYSGRDVPYFVMSPMPTADLGAYGWQLGGHPPFMYRPAGGDAPSVPDGLDVVQAATDADLAEFASALERFYPAAGVARASEPYADHRSLSPGFRVYLGRLDGRTVGCAAAVVDEGVNHVQMVAADPAVRGRGIGGALTWAATVADPSLPAVLIASDLGRSVYEHLGYVTLLRWTVWIGPPG